jgi:hypothetical protein
VHVHDPGGDGFNRTKKLRRQANPDDDGDGKNAHENNFPAARGGRIFWSHSFHATRLWQNHHGHESKKLRGPLKKRITKTVTTIDKNAKGQRLKAKVYGQTQNWISTW